MNIYCEFNKSVLKKVSKKDNGISVSHKNFETLNSTLTNVNITSKTIAKKIGKSMGLYSTLFCEDYNYLSNDSFNFITETLINEIKKIIEESIKNKENPKFFVVGLGNKDISADSLGLRVVDKLITTSLNLKSGNLSSKNFGNVFSICPSVASKNGIYTLSIIKAITTQLKPDIVIVVDSLSCKDIKYMCKTFQINNSGLTPGCEIGNKQPKIDSSSLKVPVISIGCPVVTNLSNITKKFCLDYVLTLKDIDAIIYNLADIISFSLNKVIHKNLKDGEIIYLSKK